MATSITPEVVSKVASLARLHLTQSEQAHLAKDMQQILKYIERLSEVDTEDIEPLAHAADARNVLRADVVAESLPVNAALANAPQTDGQFFLVPPILEHA